MTMNIRLSEITFNPVKSKNGLLCFVSFILNESFYHKEALRHGEEGSAGYLQYIEEEALAKAIIDKGKQLSDDERVSFIDWIKRLFAKLRAVMGLHGMSVQQVRKLTLDEFAESALRDIFAVHIGYS